VSGIIHETRPVKVWVDVDAGIADFVLALNDIPGIRTHASCQGTFGEGGAEPYGAHVMVTWKDDDALARLSHLRMRRLGAALGYVYPTPMNA
jgi:hypothetical protein